MITSVEIKDNTQTPYGYMRNLEALANGKVYTFKKGVNVIVGKNGCGKTTLLKSIYDFCLCRDSIGSKAPRKALDMIHFFPISLTENNTLLDGVKVKADYLGKVYRLMCESELKDSNVSDNIENVVLSMDLSASSTGEKMINAVDFMLGELFNEKKSHKFPIEKLAEMGNDANITWKERIENLLRYYKENRIEVTDADFEFTALLDEPDRNLDFENIQSIYNILRKHKKGLQIIAVIHNPILIYKLSKCKGVNFVEMTEGYVQGICDFVEK